MSAIGRPKALLLLTDEQRTVLERWGRRGRTAQSLALHSKIVLECADGKSNNDVASQLGTSPQTVCKWRSRFVASRLEGRRPFVWTRSADEILATPPASLQRISGTGTELGPA